jgi:hypothetical protein
MKEKELEKQLQKIKGQIERKKLIEKATVIAEKYGENRSETYPYRIKHWSNFSGKTYSGEELRIKGSSGWSDFGGEDLEVNYGSQRVFYVSTSPVYRDFGTPAVCEKENQIKIGELYVHQYTPGDWEKQLALIYRIGPKKERPKIEKPIERDVDLPKLEELASRLPIKLK